MDLGIRQKGSQFLICSCLLAHKRTSMHWHSVAGWVAEEAAPRLYIEGRILTKPCPWHPHLWEEDMLQGQWQPWPSPLGALELQWLSRLSWLGQMVRSSCSVMTRLLGRGCQGRGMTLMEVAAHNESFPWRDRQLTAVHWQMPRSWDNRLLLRGDPGGVSWGPPQEHTWEWVFWRHRSWVFSLLHNVTFISWARFPFMTLGRCPKINVCGGSF